MAETSYDVIEYPSHPLAQTHPDRLAAIAIMHGLSPAMPDRCRVLELGGGDGYNVIPMALSYPNSTYLGVDLAESAVARGLKMKAALGAKNVTLSAANVLDFPADAGQFDYIIAHGLYSWVPQIVRDKIMAVCRDHLAPNGIAYISYNAMPGGHIRQIFRDMMRFHVRDIPDPQRKIDQAMSLLHFIAKSKQKDQDSYAGLLQDELKRGLLEKDRSVVYHDDLADINQPYYFHEFMAHASDHGMQYLSEADFFEMTDQKFPESSRVLQDLGERDWIMREQYLDFLKCRRFRQTLLIRDNLTIDRTPVPDRLRGMWISSRVKPESANPSLAHKAPEAFREKGGGALTIDHPLAKAALIHLGEQAPLPIRYAELAEAARKRPGLPADPGEERVLLEVLYEAFVIGLVELHACPQAFVRWPSERPMSSQVARWQLEQGEIAVTNMRHSLVRVEPGLSRELIMRLDGTRDRAALINDLTKWALANPIPGQPAMSEEEIRRLFNEQLEPGLQGVASMGLLVR